MSVQTVVYTALLGGYEQLNEQPMANESDLRFVCFTDDPTLTSKSWEVVVVEPYFAEDLSRSQRFFKLLPHRHFPDVKRSLYIDNTIVLTKTPEQIISDHHRGAFTNFYHSNRSTLIEEFSKVLQYGIDDTGRVYEQLNHLHNFAPEHLEGPVYWGAFMIRDHLKPDMIDFAERWWASVLRYSRRDQLSLPIALNQSGVQVNALEYGNKKSPFHRWPVAIHRQRFAPKFSAQRNMAPILLEKERLQQRLNKAEKALNNLPKTVFYRLRDRLLGSK